MADEDLIGIDTATHVPQVVKPHPRGEKGVRRGVEEVARFIERDMRRRPVVAWTGRVLHAANLPDPRGYPNPDRIVWALFDALKKEAVFVRDPVDTEFMAGTEQILCLDPHGFCLRRGDCDDQVIALGSAIASAGIPVRLRVRFFSGQEQAHIDLEYDRDPRLGGDWGCIDPSVEDGVCSTAPATKTIVREVHMGSDANGVFVGMGSPPIVQVLAPAPDERASGSMGQAQPAAPATLPPDQEQAWLQILQTQKTSLDGSIARLRAKSAALAEVRADLGMPVNDPSPPPAPVTPPSGGGETPAPASSLSPLAQYAATKQWTVEAQAAESKLLATADFISACLGDGLSGARALYWTNGDLGIEAKPGDPFRVLMAPDPSGNGNLVPTYFDPVTNLPTGQLGILPIILGAAVLIVVSIAAAYATDKICTYLAQSHHDDMVQKLANEQQTLVGQGKQTPEQAAAFVKAATDLSNSGPPAAKSGGLEFPWWTLAIAVLAGGLAVWFAPRILGAASGAFSRRSSPAPATAERRRRRRRTGDFDTLDAAQRQARHGGSPRYVYFAAGKYHLARPDEVTRISDRSGRASRRRRLAA